MRQYIIFMISMDLFFYLCITTASQIRIDADWKEIEKYPMYISRNDLFKLQMKWNRKNDRQKCVDCHSIDTHAFVDCQHICCSFTHRCTMRVRAFNYDFIHFFSLLYRCPKLNETCVALLIWQMATKCACVCFCWVFFCCCCCCLLRLEIHSIVSLHSFHHNRNRIQKIAHKHTSHRRRRRRR